MTGAEVREGLRIDVFTIFPDLVAPWTEASLIGKAGRAGLLDLGSTTFAQRPAIRIDRSMTVRSVAARAWFSRPIRCSLA